MDEVLQRIEQLELKVFNEADQIKPPSKLGELMNKLKEQGSQRGILMLIGSAVPLLGLPTETVIQIVSAIFMIIGTQNIVTEG